MSHDKKTTAGIAAVVVFTLLGGIGMFFHTRSIPPLWLLEVFKAPVLNFGLSPDGSRALVASSDTAARDAVKLVDLTRREVLGSVPGWYGALAVGFLAPDGQKEYFVAVFANRVCILDGEFPIKNTELTWRDDSTAPVTSLAGQICVRINIHKAYFSEQGLVVLTDQGEILHSTDGLLFISWGENFQSLVCGITRCVARDARTELVWISIPDGKFSVIAGLSPESGLSYLAESGPVLLITNPAGQVHAAINGKYTLTLPLPSVKILSLSRNGAQMLAINAEGNSLLSYTYPDLKFRGKQKLSDLRFMARQPGTDKIIFATGGSIGSASFK